MIKIKEEIDKLFKLNNKLNESTDKLNREKQELKKE